MATALVPTLTVTPATAAATGQGFHLNRSDLRFILEQIQISERHAREATPGNPCAGLLGPAPDQIPDTGNGRELPWGLRTVDGTCNNLFAGRAEFGSAGRAFPRSTATTFMTAEPNRGAPTTYQQTSGTVVDSRPRLVSNLVVDQSTGNPAAVEAAGPGAVADPTTGDLPIPNVAPDTGLSAPYNSMFTLFGQFFDHGLDLVTKGGNGSVYIPLAADDPLIVGTDGKAGTADDPANPPPPSQRFMVLTRATNQPGGAREHTNLTTSFVDQNQTYTSHPSHQVFLREYALDGTGRPVSTGDLLGAQGGMATWADLKRQAATLLGIRLADTDAVDVPLLATDPYGRFIPGPNGFPQVVTGAGLLEGDPAADGGRGVAVPADALRTGHPFLADIAHHATPTGDRNPSDGPGPYGPLDPDGDAGTSDDHDFATYDDEMLDAHYMAGDGRVNENIGLTAVHHVFHSEHSRLVEDIKQVLTTEDPTMLPEWTLAGGDWNGERLFQAARFVNEMEYQHLVFEEFGRKVQPLINVFSGYDSSIDASIRAEFAHAVYRFGHSMLTDSVARDAAGPGRQDVTLLDGFLNPPLYQDGGAAGHFTPDQAAGAIVMGMSRQVGEEIDEFVTGSLRNSLLGLPLDLATINIARARETGVAPLNAVRRRFYAASGNSALKPYESWADFAFSLKHRASLTNFVAAYGTHPSITGTAADRRAAAELLVAADASNPATPQDAEEFLNSDGPTWANNANGSTVTGVDAIDLWTGGLAEKQVVFGGLLGSTFNYVFENQMEDLQDGDRFYYLTRTAGLNLLVQLEGNSLAEIIMRNTSATGLPADAFSRPEYIFDVGALGNTGPIADDPGTEDYDEGDRASQPGLHLGRTPGRTGVRYSGPAHATFNGTPGDDRIWASEGDDTIRGEEGDDRMQGGDGVDNLIGGRGDDIMEDLAGDDTLKGGDGNDALSSGQGFGADLNQGGRGNDFVVGGNDITETFAGPGDDLVFGGSSTDTVFGDDGDDWIEGGNQADLLQGDNGAPFQDDRNEPGHDVINGGGAGDDYDAEGGDDIMVSGPGVERNEGMLGFDWVTHQGDPTSADADMAFSGLLPPSVDALRDRFDLTEGLSGWTQDDVLRGDDRVADAVVPGDEAIGNGHQLTAAGIARIDGLAALLPGGATSFGSGNLILGGGGSDTIEGRGGDDVINGDAQLVVKLRAPDLATADPSDVALFNSMTELQSDVFAGRINPGQISIVRQIETPAAAGAVDTAVFSEPQGSYRITRNADGSTTVAHVGGTGADGTDRLSGIERMVFGTGPAASVPDAPAIGTVTAGDGSATVSFSTPDDGGSPITEFRIEVLTGTTVTRTVEGISPAASSTRITGLTNGTSYRFRVIALNAIGSSVASAASNVVTPAPPPPPLTAPLAPGIGTAVAGDGSATVHWTPGPDGGSPITSYQLQVRTSTSVVATVSGIAPTATSTVVSGLTNGTVYDFQVRAVNAVGPGALSPASNPVTPRATVTATAPGAPVIGTATAGVAGGRVTATANWQPPTSTGGSPILHYRILALRMSVNGTIAGITRSALQGPAVRTLQMTLPAVGNYRFQVVAVNGVGTSVRSARSNLVAGR